MRQINPFIKQASALIGKQALAFGKSEKLKFLFHAAEQKSVFRSVLRFFVVFSQNLCHLTCPIRYKRKPKAYWEIVHQYEIHIIGNKYGSLRRVKEELHGTPQTVSETPAASHPYLNTCTGSHLSPGDLRYREPFSLPATVAEVLGIFHEAVIYPVTLSRVW